MLARRLGRASSTIPGPPFRTLTCPGVTSTQHESGPILRAVGDGQSAIQPAPWTVPERAWDRGH